MGRITKSSSAFRRINWLHRLFNHNGLLRAWLPPAAFQTFASTTILILHHLPMMALWCPVMEMQYQSVVCYLASKEYDENLTCFNIDSYVTLNLGTEEVSVAFDHRPQVNPVEVSRLFASVQTRDDINKAPYALTSPLFLQPYIRHTQLIHLKFHHNLI